jgi:hypothetical protein
VPEDTGLWACVIKSDKCAEALATSNGRLVVADDVTELRKFFGNMLFVREVPVYRGTKLPIVRPAELIAERDQRTDQASP